MWKSRYLTVVSRLLVLSGIVALAAGPALAAPAVATHTLSIAAPHAPAPHAPSSPLDKVAPFAMLGSIANLRDPGTLSKKFVQRASAAAPDYKDGVSNAGSTWEQHAGNAEASWEQGTQAAIANKRFAKGVGGKGGKYQTNAVNLGATRYPQGVANAGDAWSRGVQPYFAAMKGADLGPKGPRRSPQNQQRSAKMNLILANVRQGS